MTPVEAARIIADDLRGTCGSILDSLETYAMDERLELDADFCHELDQLVFCCDVCGWWDDLSQMAGDNDSWACVDCVGDEE